MIRIDLQLLAHKEVWVRPKTAAIRAQIGR